MNELTAKRSYGGKYLDLYLDGAWIADIHMHDDGRLAFFTGELDTIARKGNTASAMLLIGGPDLVEIRHDLEHKVARYAEAVFDEVTGNE
jgi:hypothetical protein